jgi:predicted ATPase/class 3 adenylate cyclase
MEYDEVLAQILELLQRERRLSYRMLKRRFALDDDFLEDVKEDLIYAKQLAVDEDNRVLVWRGNAGVVPAPSPSVPQATPQPGPPESALAPVDAPSGVSGPSDAERRQLTVLFCDLVDSTRLASQLDPEDYRAVVRTYQQACAAVIQPFEGHIAQYLGDGLLVYFGYPQAHEDDAQRAVRTGLGILNAMQALHMRLGPNKGVRVAVRLGIHTGLVVVGAMGGGDRQEQLALGDTPNIAARLQGLAAPDTLVISTATYRLVQGYFVCQDLGMHTVKGVDQPIVAYQVLQESTVQSRLDVAAARGLTPMVGRETEVTLLRERWAQARDGLGQVVLLSGEAGIGKSRLVEVLRERVVHESGTRITFRCSPYHTNSALYPVIEHIQRLLQWQRDDTPAEKLDKLEQALRPYRLALQEVVPLLAALLSVPLPERYPSLSLPPQQQRQQTQAALVAWLLEEAARHPVLAVYEDLHWADPTTLELLDLLLAQAPTVRVLILLTCRPEFQPPWATRTHLTQITLDRLHRAQVAQMVVQLTDGKPLPAEVVEQVMTKTDGVPLFVEELVKMILESGLVREEADGYTLTGPLPPLAIPTTLHDSLMARLDRLGGARALVQLAAVLGREFTYKVLQAVSPLDDATLQQSLRQLVEAELVYQRGLPPRATYVFKHALIQEAAYQSLLKRTRQQYHQQIAQTLEHRFPEIVETQPELLAHHYTEASLPVQAVVYWHRAGQRAIQISANTEAIRHLTKGLEMLKTLPVTPEHTQHELLLHLALGVPLIATRGYGSLEVKHAYTRAWELCQRLGESPQRFLVLRGLWNWYLLKAELQTAFAHGQQLLTLAQRQHDPALLVEACRVLGSTLSMQGEHATARTYLEQGIALYDRQQHRELALQYGADPGVICRLYVAQVLWILGYVAQALYSVHDALHIAREVGHPFSVAFAQNIAAVIHHFRREIPAVQELAEANITLSTEQRIAQWLAQGIVHRGWALVEQGQRAQGITYLHQGLAAWRSTGAELMVPYYLSLVAEGYGKEGRTEDGLTLVTEALVRINNTGECWAEADLHRLKGELLLSASVDNHAEAEHSFQQALTLARRQQAKSWELRAAMSLGRFWQQQGKRAEAYDLLAPVYGWFTEGFDTADLQEAKALLNEFA